jgi:Ca2+-binding RTX toxin-like protein
LTVNLASTANCVFIGMAVWGGQSSRPTLCWAESNGTEHMVALRSDSGNGPMNQDVLVYALGGNDTVEFAPSNSVWPPTSCDCNSEGTWNKLIYDGHFLDVLMGDGADLVNGPRDSGDSYCYGDGGDDQLYSWSSIGRLYGGSGADALVMAASGSTIQLWGNDGNDCLQAGDSYQTLDCGSGTDARYSGNTSHNNCEQVEYQCCGFC